MEAGAIFKCTHARARAVSNPHPRPDHFRLHMFAKPLLLPHPPTARSSSPMTPCTCRQCAAASGTWRVSAKQQSGAVQHASAFFLSRSARIHLRCSFVHITASPDELLSRNTARAHPVPAASLLKIVASLEAPLASRNYYETPVLTLRCDDSVATNARIVVEWLGGCWQVMSALHTCFNTVSVKCDAWCSTLRRFVVCCRRSSCRSGRRTGGRAASASSTRWT